MALQQRTQHAQPMVLTFVRLVPVHLTKMTTHALDALRVVRVNTKQEHRVMAAEAVTPKRVQRAPVVVRTNTSQEHCALVLETVIPKRVRCALLVALEKDKRLLVLRHRIVFVLKTFVRVPMALQQRAQRVLTVQKSWCFMAVGTMR